MGLNLRIYPGGERSRCYTRVVRDPTVIPGWEINLRDIPRWEINLRDIPRWERYTLFIPRWERIIALLRC